MHLTYRLLVLSILSLLLSTRAFAGSCSAPVSVTSTCTLSGDVYTCPVQATSGASFQCAAVSPCSAAACSASAPETVLSWTPTGSGVASVDTCSSSTSYDSVVYVRSSNCSGGSQIICNDDFGTMSSCPNASGVPHSSKATWNAVSGTTYYIFVDSYGSAGGNFVLHLTRPAGGGTTTTVVTTTTTSTTVVTTTTTSGPTTTTTTLCVPGDTTPPESTPHPLVATANDCTSINVSWGTPSDTSGIARYFIWTYNQPLNQFNVAAFVSGHPPVTNYVYTGFPKTLKTTQYFVITAEDNCGNQSEFDMQELFGVYMSGCPATTTTTTTTSTTTTRATTSSTTTSTVVTSTTTTTVVTTGTCGSPVVVNGTNCTQNGVNFTCNGTTMGSGSVQMSSPSGSCSGAGNDAPEQVYSYTPTVTGTATVSTCGGNTDFDTVLYMRTSACSITPEVTCNDDFGASCLTTQGTPKASLITPTLTASTPYYIVVDGHGSVAHNFTLNIIGATPTSSTTTTTQPTSTGTWLWDQRVRALTSGAAATIDSVAVDSTDNIVVSGNCKGTVDFGNGTPIGGGAQDGFVAKYSPAGTYIWAKRMPADSADAVGVAVDSSDNVIVVGQFRSNIDVGAPAPLTTSSGNYNAFLVKYNSSGGHTWSKAIGGTSRANGNSIAVDSSGNLGVSGDFTGTVDFGGVSKTSNSYGNVFLAKFAQNGALTWVKSFTGGSGQNAGRVAVDSSDNFATSGSFRGSVDFGGGALTSIGNTDTFAVKYLSNGTYSWSKRGGGDGNETSLGMTMRPNGNVLITGSFEGTGTWEGHSITSMFAADIYLVEYTSAGAYVSAVGFGSNQCGSDSGESVAIDPNGNILLTGEIVCPASFGGAYLVAPALTADVILVKFTSSGTHLWSRRNPGPWGDRGRSVITDHSGFVIVGGSFQEKCDFGGGERMSAASTSIDAFIAKYRP